CGKYSPAVKPTDTSGKDVLPIEIPRRQLRRRLITTIVKNNRGANPLPPVAVNGGHIRALHPIMLEVLVKRLHTHGPDSLCNEIANGVIRHRGHDSGPQPEAIGEVGGDVEFTTTNVDVATVSLTKGDNSRVKPMHQGTK